MNLFEQTIGASNKAIRGQRAQLIGEDVKSFQTKLIQALEDEKRTLMRKQMDLEDLSPDSVMSLQPVGKDFNAQKWVEDMQYIQIQLIELDVRLKVAKATADKYFTDIEEKPKAPTTPRASKKANSAE